MHELEQHSDGGTAFVAGHNIDAWHQLGTVLPAGLTAQDVMTYARLGGWDVRKREISTTLISTTLISAAGVTNMIVDGKYVTVRTNPITGAEEVIGQATGQAGIVGDTYKCFQNEQLTDYLLLDQLRRHDDPGVVASGGHGRIETEAAGLADRHHYLLGGHWLSITSSDVAGRHNSSLAPRDAGQRGRAR
jgi:hypothetical protein